ncbi:hypothetical protein LTR97_012552 [Elasticomyces elasticus]|uniref:CPAF-like PDZ domain-containing protein n=1 Tax=Elasticomyces elasticus TaxID=574655 RepID=A0AAN7ZYV9_9PEZI|nr:hypothetical protein LTR97_012552 [Elasticomyces elasticus]
MTFSTRSALRASMLGLFIAQSIAQNSSYSNSTAKLEPCAVLSAAAANGITQFDAGLAMACLQSIPVDVDGDIQEILGLKVLSDLAYLKDPPPGYLYPGVDILGGLDSILTGVQAGAYKSDYDVQLDLYKLVTSAYDFHFNWVPDLVDVFGWMREGRLMSLSSDSVSLPEVYDFRDLHAFGPHNFSSSSYTPSAVTHINGVDSETWLNEFAALNPWDHDPDANYNNIFVNIPRAAVTDGGGGSYNAGWLYQGDDTVLTFANHTVRHVHTYARTSCDLSGVTDGPSFFRQCTSQKHSTIKHSEGASRVSSQNAYTPVPTADSSLRRPEKYPQPFVSTSGMTLAGYFSPDQPDVVVVACPSLNSANNYDFQNAFRSILATARSVGKSKLILDLRGNGGGTVRDGYDMFKQLFPSEVPYGAANLAAFPLVNALGDITTCQMAIKNRTDRDVTWIRDYDVIEDLTISLTHYGSWADFYGPIQRNGGNFTNLKRLNLTDRYSLVEPVYGTCAVFAELMKSQAGVHAIAVGGRKQHGPMQWVGGSKGACDVWMGEIAFSALHALDVATAAQLALAEPYTEMESVKHALTRVPEWGRYRVNFENNIREGDDSMTPLQFVYEAADYRFFYTSAMILDQSLVWQRAYDVRWNNGSCVSESTGHPSSVSGKLMEL